MSEALAVDAPTLLPYRWPNRWRPRTDVCAVLAGQTVRWVIRDVLEAVEDDAGDFADDPGHAPLVTGEHVHAHTWKYDDVTRAFAGASLRADALLHFLHDREISLMQVGYGNIVRLAAPAGTVDARVHSVQNAARILSADRGIATGERRLFDWLLTHRWIVRRGQEYAPAQSAVDAGLLAVVPRRLPHNRDLWPQVVITDTGLQELHAALGGTDPTVLDQEQP